MNPESKYYIANAGKTIVVAVIVGGGAKLTYKSALLKMLIQECMSMVSYARKL